LLGASRCSGLKRESSAPLTP